MNDTDTCRLPPVETVIAHMENGFTMKQVGDLYGTSRERVRQVLNRVGRHDAIETSYRVRKAAFARVVCRLYSEGKEPNEIADYLEAGAGRVTRILIDAGLKQRWTSRKSIAWHQVALDLDRAGITRIEITRRLGKSWTAVENVVLPVNGRSSYYNGRAEKRTELAMLLTQGMTVRDAAAFMGISEGYAYQLHAEIKKANES